MKLINPTGWAIEGFACGKRYFFGPFSEQEVWNEEHAVVLVRNLQHRGLNHIQFEDHIRDRYKGDFEKFRKDQAIEGLKRLKSWCRERWISERQAEMDVKHKAGAEADKAMIDSKRFEGDEALIQSWMDTIEAKHVAPVKEPVQQVSPTVVKKRGRKPKIVESSNDQNVSPS